MRIKTLVLAVAAPVLLSAQADLRMGPRLGLSLSTQTAGGQLFSNGGLPKLGPIIGWSFDIPWTEQFHFLVEPMWMSKGSWTRNATLKTSTYVTLNYLELPVMLKLSVNPDPQGTFLTGGVMYGYWMGGRNRTVVDGQTQSDFKYNLANSTAKRSQWSVGIGLGREHNNWMWEVRAQTSVTPWKALVSVQNAVLGIHLTWRLPLTTAEKKQDNG
ncbi:MAG: porin family protein [Flavobacteriales bacterium]